MEEAGSIKLTGNLGGDPEMRYTPSGEQVAMFKVAVRERDQRSGIVRHHTEWHRCVARGREIVDTVANLRKGALVWIEGEFRPRTWKGPGNVERSVMELHILNIRSLGSETAVAAPVTNQEGASPVRSPLEAAMAAGLIERPSGQ